MLPVLVVGELCLVFVRVESVGVLVQWGYRGHLPVTWAFVVDDDVLLVVIEDGERVEGGVEPEQVTAGVVSHFAIGQQ